MESGGVLTKLGNCQEASPYFPLSTRQTAPLIRAQNTNAITVP